MDFGGGNLPLRMTLDASGRLVVAGLTTCGQWRCDRTRLKMDEVPWSDLSLGRGTSHCIIRRSDQLPTWRAVVC